MKEGPDIAPVAALFGDPARANMLTALIDGRALTASELAHAAGVSLPTASGHLARLLDAAIVGVTRQGRHRYFRLADKDVAAVIESLSALAERSGAKRVRTGPRDTALRAARICYDHLAGECGVALVAGARARGLIEGDEVLTVTANGRTLFEQIGVDMAAIEDRRRPLCRPCLDWSERRTHLGGALGSALLARMLALGWIRRGEGRVLTVTRAGDAGLAAAFGVS